MSLDPTRSITLRKNFASAGNRRYGLIVRNIDKHLDRIYDGLTFPLFGQFDSVEQILRQLLNEYFVPQVFDQYPIQGYMKGIRLAYNEVRLAEFNRPTPQGLAEFTRGVIEGRDTHRNLSQVTARFRMELGAVNEAVLASVLRGLASLQQQYPSRAQVKAVLKEQFDKVGKVRFTILAHDTIVRAHAEGQLDAFKALGIHRMESVPELESVTAGDTRVCSLCRDKLVVKIDDARNLIPRHARCRCRWGLVEIDRKLLKNRRNTEPVLERTTL